MTWMGVRVVDLSQFSSMSQMYQRHHSRVSCESSKIGTRRKQQGWIIQVATWENWMSTKEQWVGKRSVGIVKLKVLSVLIKEYTLWNKIHPQACSHLFIN
jgi:hypothetical protein